MKYSVMDKAHKSHTAIHFRLTFLCPKGQGRAHSQVKMKSGECAIYSAAVRHNTQCPHHCATSIGNPIHLSMAAPPHCQHCHLWHSYSVPVSAWVIMLSG